MERYYQPEIECASREQLKRWQSERLVAQVRRVWENVPYYRKKMEEKGVAPEDIRGVEDLPKLPFLSKADLRDAYPYGGLRPHPLHLRHHRQAGGGLLHPARHRPLGGLLRSGPDGGGGHGRGRGPGVLRLRPVHRRGGPGRREPQGGLPHGAHVLRQHGPADHVHPGFERHHPLRHPQLRGVSGRADAGAGPRARGHPPEGGHLRGGGLVRGDAAGHPEDPGHQGLRHLRAHGAFRPRRQLRVLRPGGHAHQRGPLHPRDHRPGHGRGAPRGRAGRAGHHRRGQGSLPHDPVQDQGHLLPDLREVPLRPDPRAHDQTQGQERRHAHHPGRQRVPQPDRDGAPPARLRGQLPDPGGPGQQHGHLRGAGGDAPCWASGPRSPWWPPRPSPGARARRCGSSTSARYKEGSI